MGSALDATLRSELKKWEAEGLERTLREALEHDGRGGRDDATDDADPRRDFRSNDYLGLSRDPAVLAAAHAALEEFGAGGRAARLLGGGSPLAAKSEHAVAEWLRAEAALLFPSGWQANLGVIGALAGRGDALFSDELNHASLIDGCRLSRARVHVFRHGDLQELARQLARSRAAMRRVVVTESIFGMDGDLAPLERLNELCERHDAWLVVDEAHAAGLLGREGAGAWAATAIDRRADSRLAARVVTGGKALGVGGAFVVGSAALRDLLLHRARAFVYTTSPPPVVAGALIAAIDAARRADEARARVLALAHRLAVGLRGGASARASAPAGAVVIEPVGDARAAVERGDRLLRDGFAVGVVRPPTVPQGGSRLRIVAHAFNDEAAADELVHRVVALRAPHDRIEVRVSSSPTWFVVGTDTNVGKTIVSALLVRAAKRLGPAAYWKPVQTGTDDDTATVRALAGARDDELLPNAAHFALPASPHEAAAAEHAAIEPAQLAWPGALAGRRAIVELAGGLLVPYRGGAESWLQADWLESRRARVLLVARSGLGTLNHTLLTLEALRARHLEAEALFLVGPPHASNAATLREQSGVARVHEVPTFSPLATAALDAWLDQHDLRDLLEST